MNCEQMTTLLSAFLDGELTAQEEKQMKEHLEQCADCRALFEQLQTLHTSFSDLEEIPAPEDFAQGIMSRIKAESKPKVVPLFKRPQFRAVMGMAACAVLCIGFGRVALSGSGKSTAQAPEAAAPMAPAPESAMYDVAAAEEGIMEYSATAGLESKQVEAPMEPAAPAAMEPAEPAIPEAADQNPMTTVVSPTGPGMDSAVNSHEGQLYLTQLPDGLEDAIGPLKWEEREVDGALCALLTPNQAEKVMELAHKQGLTMAIGDPAGGEPEAWLLILTE